MLLNTNLANQNNIATAFGPISFNEKGESRDLTVEQEQEIAKARGFEFVEEKKPSAKPATKKLVKEESAEEGK